MKVKDLWCKLQEIDPKKLLLVKVPGATEEQLLEIAEMIDKFDNVRGIIVRDYQLNINELGLPEAKRLKDYIDEWIQQQEAENES